MTEQPQQVIGKSLGAKIMAVQKAVTNIPKRGKNKQQGYDYVLAADAVDHVRQACNDAELVVAPISIDSVENVREWNTSGGSTWYVTRVKISYLIMDPASGESLTVQWQGEGADGQDKGLNKAYTVCFKYFIMTFFMVAGEGLDPENPAYDAADDKNKPARGRQKSAAKAGSTASDAKIKYITDLMASEWIPGPIRTAVAAWLETQKGKWSESGATKTIEQLKKFWPVGKSAKGATDKQVALIEKLVKSDGVPKNLADKAIEDIANFRTVPDAVLTVTQASAMIECCQWYIDKAKADAAAPPQPAAEAKADKAAGDEVDAIQGYLERIDAQVAKRTAPNESMLKAVQEWRADSSWTLEQCKAMLDDVRDWPMTETES